jgi:chemotaxis protein CheC
MEKMVVNEDQLDALQEVANIGASHAATSLSMMVNKEIKIGIPKVKIIPLNKITDSVKDQEVAVGILLEISNDEVPISILLLISKESAFSLANLLLGNESYKKKDVLSEIEQSALMEVSNVMMSSFFDSITEMIGISMIPGPPRFAYDIPQAIMDFVLIKIGEIADEVMIFNCDICEKDKESFEVNMLLLPKPQSIKIILERLGMN